MSGDPGGCSWLGDQDRKSVVHIWRAHLAEAPVARSEGLWVSSFGLHVGGGKSAGSQGACETQGIGVAVP